VTPSVEEIAIFVYVCIVDPMVHLSIFDDDLRM